MSGALIVRFTRLSPTHHRFEAVREDGTRVERELETKSLLRHDLVHFALESEGKLTHGFYGLLARGEPYEEGSAEAMEIEAVVGPLQSATKDDLDADAFVAARIAHKQNIGETAPSWLTPDLIRRASARLRQLEGQWRATPFGETMELRF